MSTAFMFDGIKMRFALYAWFPCCWDISVFFSRRRFAHWDISVIL